MVSWKVVVVMLMVTVLIHHLDATQNRTRGANRQNRNRGNNRARGGARRAGGGGGRGGRRGGRGGRGRPLESFGCEEIQVPMCKGLIGYTHTKLPNRFNHTTQLQAYRELEHLWGHIDTGCSQNFRLLACSLYLPKCVRRGPGREPCRKTCKVTQRVCRTRLQQRAFECPAELCYMSLDKRRCLKHGPHQACTVDYTLCQPIELPMCQGLPFSTGMSPNMFGQCNQTQIAREMHQFAPLIGSNCSASLGFFLCGVYQPFCTEFDGVMYFPCRELCQEVRSNCEAAYNQLTGGLPWPNKFQCHRYPPASDDNYRCVMPDDEPAISMS